MIQPYTPNIKRKFKHEVCVWWRYSTIYSIEFLWLMCVTTSNDLFSLGGAKMDLIQSHSILGEGSARAPPSWVFVASSRTMNRKSIFLSQTQSWWSANVFSVYEEGIIYQRHHRLKAFSVFLWNGGMVKANNLTNGMKAINLNWAWTVCYITSFPWRWETIYRIYLFS